MRDITIVEVGPRDGLQNESGVLLDRREGRPDRPASSTRAPAGSRPCRFVHPKLVPPMADAEAVMARGPARATASSRRAAWSSTGTGLDRAVAAGRRRGQRRRRASATRSRGRNQNVDGRRGDADGGRRDRRRAARSGLVHHDHAATAVRLPVRGRGRPGRASSASPRRGAARRRTGAAPRRHHRRRRARPGPRPSPTRVRDAARRRRPLRAHFHNTRNTGYANALAAVEAGVDVLDASARRHRRLPVRARRPPATSPPTTSSTCSSGWGTGRGSTSTTLLPTAAFLGEQLGHEVPALLPRAGAFP